MKKSTKNEVNNIVVFSDDGVELNVDFDPNKETFWLSQKQMSELFETDQSVISRHINNVYKEKELEKETSMQKMHRSSASRPEMLYNLDVIISVGYRVHSNRGVRFRRWANGVLKDFLLKGYAIDQKRINVPNLAEITKTLDDYRKFDGDLHLSGDQLLEFMIAYNKSLTLLDSYDHQDFKLPKGNRDVYRIKYEECIDIIKRSKFSGKNDNFGKERDKSFDSSISTIYQTYDGNELYPTLEQKAAMLLYLVTKNHSFIDGNKRIASTVFLYFLDRNNGLFIKGTKRISDEALATLTILIAASDPKDKNIIINLILAILS
jgi:prophage maintenance system killer protein